MCFHVHIYIFLSHNMLNLLNMYTNAEMVTPACGLRWMDTYEIFISCFAEGDNFSKQEAASLELEGSGWLSR